MTLEEAHNTLEDLQRLLTQYRHISKELTEANGIAIQAIERQIPKKPIMEPWSPALCPTCGEQLSESVCDGYYRHYYGKRICECGQKLKWEEEE